MSHPSLMQLAIVLGGAAAVAVLLHAVGFAVLHRVGRHVPVLDALVTHSRKPARVVMVVVAVASGWSGLSPDYPWSGDISHALAIVQILAVTWLVVANIWAFEAIGFSHYDASAADNLRARKLRTQIVVLRRVSVALAGFVAVAAILFTFHGIRAVGGSLLASAGIAGLIAGAAAKPTLGNVVAGIQIAIAEPIRLDDVLVVAGEWGRVEEITLTYVVVRIWDGRRLVLPISYFVTNTFENWTRSSTKLLGTVYLYLDYRAPLDEMRVELSRILAETPLWDGEVGIIQVTGADQSGIKVRALVSAADSPTSWDLRCLVRERLIRWVQLNHPESLPRLRLVDGEDGQGAGAGGGAHGASNAFAGAGPDTDDRTAG